MKTGSYNLINHKDFSPKKVIKAYKRKHGYNVTFYNPDYISLDTETSWTHDINNVSGWIYQWAYTYQDNIIYGRTVEECVASLLEFNKLGVKTIVYVHNLSYDWQYLKNELIRRYGSDYKILADAPHKVITFTCGALEFRCSYRLSGKSLLQWSKDLKIAHPPLKGTIDYDIIRYPTTTLTRVEWLYLLRDVISLDECIKTQMHIKHDNTSTIPLTKTGYVRRDVKNAYKLNYSHNRNKMLDMALDAELYKVCKCAYAGALTHGNRFYANQTILGKIRHRDFVSHYPTQLQCKYYPCSKFNPLLVNRPIKELYKYLDDYCIIMHIAVSNVRLKNNKTTLPYLSEDKLRKGKIPGETLDIISDNGRVLKAVGLSTLCLTEIDFKIIDKYYTWDECYVIKSWCAFKGPAPQYILDVNMQYFTDKTVYKNVYHKTGSDEDYLKMMLAKADLNSIYGCMATDIVKLDYTLSDLDKWSCLKLSDELITDKLHDYYSNANNCMPYQIGLYITAHARAELMTMYELIGNDNYLYCDTDSMFYISTPGIETKIEKWNDTQKAEARSLGCYCCHDNKYYYLHQFDLEDERIISFRFLHSKCYCYEEYGDDKLIMHLTVAGVPRKTKGITRERELGNINNLKHGYKFRVNGGTRCVYAEDNSGHASAIILPTEKTLKHELAKFDDFLNLEE